MAEKEMEVAQAELRVAKGHERLCKVCLVHGLTRCMCVCVCMYVTHTWRM